MFRYGGERFLTVLRLDHLVVRTLEQIAQDLTIVLLILDHQNTACHPGLACFSTSMGIENENVEPRPGMDSTQIRPPCSSIIRFDRANPRPVPPFCFVIELSTCWNSSNNLA